MGITAINKNKALFSLVTILLVIAMIEGASYITYYYLYKTPFSFTELDRLRNGVLHPASQGAGPAQGPAAGAGPEKHYKLLHPYFGFIVNPLSRKDFNSKNYINEYGFFGPNPLGQDKSHNNFNVIVVGGSVATIWLFDAKETLKNELQAIPELAGREIEIYNLGSGAFKQPQQVMILVDLLARGVRMDALVNIDGVNEIALPLVHGSFREQFSPFFPDNWRARSETRFPPDRLRIITAIFATKERRYDMANIINRWPFKRSVLVNLLWKRYDEAQKIHHVSLESDLHRYGDSKFTAKTVNIAGQKFKLDYDRSWASENGNQYTTQDGRTFLGPPSGISTERDWYIDSSRYWANCSIMLNNFAASQGAIYLHFIQPNQYFDNKKMGSHEKSVAIQQGSPWGLAVRSGYPYLLIAGDALNKKGVSFFDFSTLFSRETEEIYIDNCCHFNKYGNDILAKAIANKIMISLTADGKAKLAQVPNGNDYDFSLKMLKYYSTNPNSYKDGSDAPVPKYMGALRQ